jgi:hypothetical protein
VLNVSHDAYASEKGGKPPARRYGLVVARKAAPPSLNKSRRRTRFPRLCAAPSTKCPEASARVQEVKIQMPHRGDDSRAADRWRLLTQTYCLGDKPAHLVTHRRQHGQQQLSKLRPSYRCR